MSKISQLAEKPGAQRVNISGQGMDRVVAKKMPIGRRIGYVAAAILVALFIYWLVGMLLGGRSLSVNSQRVFISDVTVGTFEDFIPLRGRLVPRSTVYLDAIEGGRVEEVLVEDGAMVEAGDFEGAWRELVSNNPLPSIHGRVCYHPCEDVCNRAFTDSTVSIHAVERFLGDLALKEGWQFEKPERTSGKKILVIGAGPSGLSAAYHLVKLGHEVEIREAGPVAGGMIHFGIPAYRMPRDELQAEIDRIENMGVKITLNHRVEDVLAEKDDGGFDAVFSLGVLYHRRDPIDHLRRLHAAAAPHRHGAGPEGKAVREVDRAVDGIDDPFLDRRLVPVGGRRAALLAA